MFTEEDNQGQWQVYVAIVAILALFMFVGFYSYVAIETDRQSNARTAKGVVIEKNFAPGQGIAGISSGGHYGVGSTADRYIVAVRATEGATGLKEIDVHRSVYYRLSVGSEVKLIITRADLNDDGKYKVEIDPASIPAQPAIPPKAQEQPNTGDTPTGNGQIKYEE